MKGEREDYSSPELSFVLTVYRAGELESQRALLWIFIHHNFLYQGCHGLDKLASHQRIEHLKYNDKNIHLKFYFTNDSL